MEYEITIQQTNEGLMNNAKASLELVNSEAFKKYNYTVTSDIYDLAKEDKKKLSDALEKAKRQRIDFEKKMLEDWEPIKKTFMKAEKVIEGYVSSLKDGIDKVDTEEAKARESDIHSYYIQSLNELQIPFDKIFDKKWTNKSCAKKEWQEGIKKKIANLELDYSLLERTDVEDKELLKAIFMQTWDRLEAITKYDAQMEAKKKSEELKNQKEEKEQSIEQFHTSTYIKEPRTEIRVNEMVSITGEKLAYQKVRDYALSLGLTWRVL